MNFAHGAIQWEADAVNTVYTVSGLAFQPKALRFYMNGLASTGDTDSDFTILRKCLGFATSTSNRAFVYAEEADNAGSMLCVSRSNNNGVIGSGGADLLDLNSITSDGFTLIVRDALSAGNARTVFWEAWGGADITVALVGNFLEPAGIGTVDYTVTGFAAAATDQVVMFGGVTQPFGAAANADSCFTVGFATTGDAANNVTVVGNEDEGSSNSDTDGYCKTGECLAMIATAGGNATCRAQLTQFNTNGFRLNWIARAVTGRQFIFLAIKGGGWNAGALTIAGNTLNATAAVTDLAYAPIGVCLAGRMTAEQSAGISTAEDRMSLGTGTSTSSRRAVGWLSLNGQGSSDISLTMQYDQVLAYPSAGALVTAYDISSMDSGGFTLINDLAGGVASEWIGYLAFGTTEEAATPVAASESLAVALSEAVGRGYRVIAAESLAAGLGEAKTTRASLRVSEALAILAGDVGFPRVSRRAVETLAVVLAEPPSRVALILRALDAIVAGLAESPVGLLGAVRVLDALSVVPAETVRIAGVLRVAESLGVVWAELARITAALVQVDGLPIGLADVTQQLLGLVRADDTLPVSLTDVLRDLAAGTQSTEALSISLADAGLAAVTFRAFDLAALGLLETGTVVAGEELIQKAGADMVGLTLEDLAHLATVMRTVDAVSVVMLESPGALAALVAATDVGPVALVETALVSAVLRAADVLGIGVAELAGLLARLAALDTTSLEIVESVQIPSVVLRTADTVVVLTADAGQLRITVQGADAAPVGVADALGALLGSLSSLDVTSVGFADLLWIGAQLAGTDPLTVLVIEGSRTPAVVLRAAETWAVLLAIETGWLGIGVAGSDPVAVGTLDLARPILVRAVSGDDAALVLADAPALAALLRRAETLGLAAEDVVRLALVVRAMDTVGLTAADLAMVARFTRAADLLALGLSESATLTAFLRAAEALHIASEERAALFARLAAAEALGVSLIDLGRAAIRMQAADVAALVVEERAALRLLAFDVAPVTLLDISGLIITGLQVLPGLPETQLHGRLGATGLRARLALTTRSRAADLTASSRAADTMPASRRPSTRFVRRGE